MNQILKPELNISEETFYSNCLQEKNNNNMKKKNKNSKNNKFLKSNHFYLFQFLISSFIATCFLIVFCIRMLRLHEKEAVSEKLTRTYKISTLYANNTDYSAQRIQNGNSNNSSFPITPFVIGMIKIDKINLSYPILSESNKEFLNISVCRFAGPMPNEEGNLCIART